jgi:hypothetical protein
MIGMRIEKKHIVHDGGCSGRAQCFVNMGESAKPGFLTEEYDETCFK